MTPPLSNLSIEVPGNSGRAIVAKKSDLVRIVDIEGCQIGDLFLLVNDEVSETFSPAMTRLVNFTPFPKIGQAFYSTRRRVMATLVADTSPGRHDMTFAPCDENFYIDLGAGENHPNCRNNFDLAMKAADRPITVYPDPVNVFQNTPVNQNGEYVIGKTLTKPGDYIELRCEMDLLLVLTACSVDIPVDGVQPIGGKSTPLRIEIIRS